MFMRFKAWVKPVLIATAVALIFRLWVLEDYRISSDSMAPSLLSGDLVLVNKAAYNMRLPFSTFEVLVWGRPHYGDVVAFTLPERGGTFVKRVYGLEGDRLEIKDGVLLRNGQRHEVGKDDNKISDFGPIDVPKGHFFVIGDNRGASVDSRVWGPVPYACLKGRVSLVWMSLDPRGIVRGDRIGRPVT